MENIKILEVSFPRHKDLDCVFSNLLILYTPFSIIFLAMCEHSDPISLLSGPFPSFIVVHNSVV